MFVVLNIQSQVLIVLLLGDKLNNGNIEFGLDGGVNYSSISDMKTNNKLNTFNLGFYFDFKIKNQWYLNTGVLVKSNLGIKDLTEADLDFLQITKYDAEGTYRQRMNYFLVPALAKYKFKNNMYVEAGPQFGLMYKAWVEFNSDVDGIKSVIKEDNKGMISRFDMGIAAGTGYKLLNGLGWTIGIRYYYGLLDVYKENSNTRNSSLFLKLNVPIGVSEEKKKQILEFKKEKEDKKKKRQEVRKNKK